MAYQVLLVEGRNADAELIRESLRQSAVACDVTHVSRLSDALSMSPNARFDVILLNLALPDSNGLDTYVAMRSHAPALPLILLADPANQQTTIEAAKKGAQDYLGIEEISPAVLGKALLYAIERKRHEHALREQKEFYENLLRDANVWVEALDRRGCTILWNRGAEKITGYDADRVLSKRTRWELLYPDESLRRERIAFFESVLESERGLRDVESVVRIEGGNSRVISWNANIIRGKDGAVVGCMLVGNDVTERRTSDRDIAESEHRFRTLSELTSDYVYAASWRPDGALVAEWVEGAFERLTGYAPEEIINRENAWLDIIHEEDRPERPAFVDDLSSRPVTLEYRIRRKNGSVAWLRDRIRGIADPENGRIVRVLGAVSDITEEKEARLSESRTQDFLLREQEKFRGILENATDGISLMDSEGRFIEWNPSMERITGIPRAQALESTHAEVQYLLTPAGQRKDGLQDRLQRQMREYLASGEAAWLDRLIHRWIERPDGGRRYIEMVSFRIRSSFDMLTGTVTRDITEIEMTEEDLEAKNRLLAQQNRELLERNEELDAFTHSVAHDLKNPLSLILGYAEMVQHESAELSHEDLNDYMGSVVFNGRKMISIINSLLLLASVRKEEVEVGPIEMEQVAKDAIRRLQKQMRDSGSQLSLPDEWYRPLGYAPWIEEVWVNYIGNAVKYCGKACRVEVRARREADGMLRYEVEDNGPGIPAERLAELFVPFTRLAQAKIEGHGLGLSIVKRIIEKLGGEVGVDSAPGRGSTFYFTLPGVEADR